LPPEAVAERLARHADGAVSGTTVTYTAKPGAAKLPHYRIVALFDAVQGFSTNEACESAFRPAVAARYIDRTNLFLAFCDENEPIAGAKVSGPKLAGIDDPVLADMMRQGMRAMFPSAGGGVDDRGGSMGSIRVSPTPGFRLNPLEGIL
jgi:hypothetical protein